MRAIWERLFSARKRVPSVFQLENAECGPAALTMILQYHGQRVTLETIRKQCNVTARDGSSARDLIRVAQAYGLGAQARRMGSLRVKTLSFPAIIHWRFNHFIVLEGVKGNTFYLRDACTGGFTATQEEFDNNYTGIVIRFSSERGRPGQNPGKPRRAWMGNGLSRYISSAAALHLFFSITALGAGLLLPFAAQAVFDRPSGTVGFQALSAVLVWGGLLWLKEEVHFLCGQKTSEKTATALLNRLLELPSLFFIARYHVGGRLGISPGVYDALVNGRVTPLLSLVALAGFGAQLFWFAPASMALALAALLVFSLGSQLYLNRRHQDLNGRTAAKTAAYGGRLGQDLIGIEALKGTCTEQEAFQSAARLQADMANDAGELAQKQLTLSFITDLIRSAGLVFLGTAVLFEALSLGRLAALGIIFLFGLDHAKKAAARTLATHNARQTLAALEDVMAAPGKRQSGLPPQSPLQSVGKQIELQHLEFGYNRFEPPVISDFFLKAGPGEMVGVWGRSGSGKTIVARLAARRYPPWSGSIRLDGKDVDSLCPGKTETAVVLVEEQPHIFKGTIRENLTLFTDGFSDGKLAQACSLACIHEDILKFPLGYDTPLSDGGRNISGGQRQRLAIARALLSGPAVLILDEALSALDAPTGKALVNRLKQTGITCILLSHNRFWIRLCPRQIVLKNSAACR